MAKRKGKKAKRKRRRRPDGNGVDGAPLVGYTARQGMTVACDGEACIVAGSQAVMVSILQHHRRDPAQYVIEKATAWQILQVLELGGAYAFDEEAYGRFLEPAQSAGLPLHEEDFSDPGPSGIHLVRVGYL